MHLLFFVGCFSLLGVAQSPITDPSQWPGWSNIRNCVEYAVWSVVDDIGCGNWPCVCDHSSMGEADLLSGAIGFCSSNEQDIATATSILNWLCSQIPNSTTSLLPGVTVTDPTQWPGWSTIRNCVEYAVWSDVDDVGCDDWTCVCGHSSIAAA